MSGGTFSLKTLLLLVTLAAVGCFALMQHTPLWGGIVVTLTSALLALATLLACVRRGPTRAYWVGFAAVGWAYTIMAFSPLLFTSGGSLLTTKSLILGWENLGPPLPPASGLDLGVPDIESQYYEIMLGHGSLHDSSRRDYAMELRAYLRIGQSLWSLALGFIAGLTAAVLHRREQRTDSAAAASPG